MSFLRLGLGFVGLLVGVIGFPVGLATPAHAAPEFRQSYIQSKLWIERKMYADALRELLVLKRQTKEGKRHFGVHYHLAVASYYLGAIRQSVMYLKQARTFTDKPRYIRSLRLLSDRIQVLFSPVHIRTKIPVEQVGRLRVILVPKQPLYHPEKKRVFSLMRKRWATRGLVLDNRPVYLPQGEYSISIPRPQCLGVGFAQGKTLIQSLDVKAQTSLSLVAQGSCRCSGGRIAQKRNNQIACVCPPGTLWTASKKRCVTAVVAKKGKGPSPWIWVSVVGAAVVTGSALAVYFLAVEPQQRPNDSAKLSGRLWRGKVQ